MAAERRRWEHTHATICGVDGLVGLGPLGIHKQTPETINPTDGSAICKVSLAQVSDIDKAVAAAKDAFENGLWGKISARDRGRLLYR